MLRLAFWLLQGTRLRQFGSIGVIVRVTCDVISIWSQRKCFKKEGKVLKDKWNLSIKLIYTCTREHGYSTISATILQICKGRSFLNVASFVLIGWRIHSPLTFEVSNANLQWVYWLKVDGLAIIVKWQSYNTNVKPFDARGVKCDYSENPYLKEMEPCNIDKTA